MTDYLPDNSSKLGFAGGLLLSTAAQLNLNDLYSTLVLGFVGAVASFVATLVCRFFLRKIKGLLKREKRG